MMPHWHAWQTPSHRRRRKLGADLGADRVLAYRTSSRRTRAVSGPNDVHNPRVFTALRENTRYVLLDTLNSRILPTAMSRCALGS